MEGRMRAQGGTRGWEGRGCSVTGFLSSASIEISEQLCRLLVWMTSWLLWQFSGGRLEGVCCVLASVPCVLSDLLPLAHPSWQSPAPPPFLAEAPQPFSLLAVRLLPSCFLMQTNEWGFLVNVFLDQWQLQSMQFEAGNKKNGRGNTGGQQKYKGNHFDP